MPKDTSYLRHIDGLRAIAVLSVVFYHADLAGLPLPGGFLGVDVFFVISGYLITALILKEASTTHGQFSYLDFYHRRVRRLLPALIAVTLVSVFAGWGLMVPATFPDFGSSVLAALLFVSNMFFLFQDSYAAESAAYQPFLHTWSLSVEEQFYLFYPFFLLLAFRSRWLKPSRFVLVTGLVSLALSTFLAYQYDDIAFFLFPARIWELAAGAWLACIAMRERVATDDLVKEFSIFAGLVMIVGSFFIIDAGLADPGLHTVPVVVGSMLVIWFGEDSKISALLLQNRVITFVGLISYSLYLWHQPSFAFTRILYFEHPHEIHIVIAAPGAFVLSVLSWRFIERPCRDRQLIETRYFLPRAVSLVVFLCLVSWAISKDVLPPLAAAMGGYPTTGERYEIAYGADKQVTDLVVIGDSHAAAMGRSMEKLFEQDNLAARGMVQAGCIYIYSAIPRSDPRGCAALNDRRRRELLGMTPPRHIFIIGRYTSPIERSVYTSSQGYVEDSTGPLLDWVCRDDPSRVVSKDEMAAMLMTDLLELSSAGHQLYVLGPVPEMSLNAYQVWFSNRWDKSNSPLTESYSYYLERNRRFLVVLEQLASSGIEVILPETGFCEPALDKCHTRIGTDWLYIDDDHVSEQGADRLVTEFIRAYERHH